MSEHSTDIPEDIRKAVDRAIADLKGRADSIEEDAEAVLVDAFSRAILAERKHWVYLLTPSGDTKAMYHGEFSFPQTITDEEGDEHTHNVYVPWTTVKEIMGFIRDKGSSSHPSLPTPDMEKVA